MLNKDKYKAYIEERIEHLFYSKIHQYKFDVKWYFERRNDGMAGIGPEEVRLLCQKAIRDLRVWKEIDIRVNK